MTVRAASPNAHDRPAFAGLHCQALAGASGGRSDGQVAIPAAVEDEGLGVQVPAVPHCADQDGVIGHRDGALDPTVEVGDGAGQQAVVVRRQNLCYT